MSVSKQGAHGKPSTPALAIATAASGEPNPNLLSAEAAEHLQKRRESLTRKNKLVTTARPRRLTEAHQAIIDLEAENKVLREAREKAKRDEIEKAALAAASPPQDSYLTEVVKQAENHGATRLSTTHSQTHKHDGLRMLAQSDGLFVESAGPEYEQIFELDLKHKYVILNSLAERVFFASETLEEYCEAFSNHREVDMTAFAGFGGLLFEIGGSTRDAKVAIRHSNDVMEFVGSVRKHRLTSTYSIYDQEMKEVFRLVRSKQAEREEVDDVQLIPTSQNPDDEEEEEDEASRPLKGRDYQLYTAEDDWDEVIGELNSHHVLKERLHTHHCYGVTFPNSLEINSKILICSALLILNFLYFEKFEVGNRRSQACAGILFSLMVAMIILFLCMLVLICILYKDYFPKRKPTDLGPPPCDEAY